MRSAREKKGHIGAGITGQISSLAKAKEMKSKGKKPPPEGGKPQKRTREKVISTTLTITISNPCTTGGGAC